MTVDPGWVNDAPAFFGVMGQVGVTAFALMLAAAQIERDAWAKDELGMVTMVGSLFELLTLTVVSLSFATQLPFLWQGAGASFALLGMSLTLRHGRTLSQYRAKNFDVNTTREKQGQLNWLPWLSFGSLLVASAWSLVAKDSHEPIAILSVVTIWLLISGCTETFLTLTPNWLSPQSGRDEDAADDPPPTSGI